MKIAGLSSPIWDGKKNHMPGEPFEIDDAAGQQLIDAKLAQEVKVVTKDVVVPVNAATNQDGNGDVDLETLSVAKLNKMAKDQGINPKGMERADLVAALRGTASVEE